MTEYELLHYHMNNDELNKWKELANEVKNNFLSIAFLIDIPSEFMEESLDRMTSNIEPFYGSKGFINHCGYYCVQEGDKGDVHLLFSDASFENARTKLIKRCARDISYDFVVKNMKDLQNKHKGLWHYCRIDDGIETVNGISKMISHIEENAGWKYDGEYDYRKYWFELLLRMERRLLDNDEYQKEIAYYQDCMNHRLKNKIWVFTQETEEFTLK